MAKMEDKCPSCGSRNVGEGSWSDTHIYVKGKIFSTSSVLSKVCGDCGAVFDLRVANPQKFSQRDKD